jgi:hypothetical protein
VRTKRENPVNIIRAEHDDFMESIWTRDIAELQWDIIRFRRIKADLITHRYKGSRTYLDVSEEPNIVSVGDLIRHIEIMNKGQRAMKSSQIAGQIFGTSAA